MLKTLLLKATEFDHDDEISMLRASVMKVYTTLLVLSQKGGLKDLSPLSPAVDLACCEIINCDKDIAVPGNMKLRSMTLPFFNRLLIGFGAELLNYAKERCSIDSFIDKWIYSMQYLNNAKTRKENAVAILGMIQIAPVSVVSKKFETLMTHVVPVVFNFIDEQQGFKPKERPQVKNRMDSYSERKEMMLRDSVVDHVNILDTFKDSIRAFEGKLQQANEKLEPFSNEGLQENVFKLMQSS